MMDNPFFVLTWVAGLSGLWIFWNRAVKKLLLDLFRERVFELRFAMFRLGMNGQLEYNSEVYRQLETLLSGLLRFGHRVTLLTWTFSKIEQEKAKKGKDYEDLSQQISLKISRLSPPVQVELTRILSEVSKAIALYMAFTSLFFLGLFFVAMVAKLLGLWRPDRVKEISGIVEQEAYQAEVKRDRSMGRRNDVLAAAL